MTLYPPAVLRIVERAGRLYSLPTVALDALRLLTEPVLDCRALAACLERDPVITAKILRVVNSSLFGLAREVTGLRQAIGLLGANPLKLLVLSCSLPKTLAPATLAEALGRYWQFTLIKAVTARQLATATGQAGGDELFLTALFQDIGVLVLLKELGPPYATLVERAASPGSDLLPLEINALGFDHRQVTHCLLERWELPIDLLPRSKADSQLELAELLAMFLLSRDTAALVELVAVSRRQQRLSIDQLAELVRSLTHQLRDLATVWAIELPEQDYSRVFAEAHEQLAEVATAAAIEIVQRREEQARLEEAPSALLAEVQTLRREVEALREPRSVTRFHTAAERAAPGPMHAGRRTKPEDVATPRDPGLHEHLQAAVVACRHARWPLSLMLVQLDDFEDLVMQRGLEVAETLAGWLRERRYGASQETHGALQLGETRFAIVLPDCSRSAAVGMGVQLLRELAEQYPDDAAGPAGPTLSIGIASAALPAKNFPVDNFLSRAESCLRAASLAGGAAIKSIEL